VIPVPLQTLEPVPEHQHVRILPTKKLQHAMQGITDFLVIHLAKRVVPVPLRILAPVLGLQIVQVVLLESIH
jgi:hypothetical protein